MTKNNSNLGLSDGSIIFEHVKMKCDELLKLLSEYVDGSIDPSICKEFERHLADCDPCRVVIDTVRKTITIYKNDRPYELPAEFRKRLHDLIRDRWKTVKAPTPKADSTPGNSLS